MKLSNVIVFGTVSMALAMEMDHSHDDHIHPSVTDDATTLPTPHLPSHHHGVPILETELHPLERQWWDAYSTHTFFSSHSSLIYLHSILGFTTFSLIYPVILILSNSKWFIPLLSLHVVLTTASSVCYFIFDTKDWYPLNIYGKLVFILCLTTWLHFLTLLGSKKLSIALKSDLLNRVFSKNNLWLTIIKWFNFGFFSITFFTSIAVLGEFGKGEAIYNLLAHFIKGGIFFLYGIITLCRYCGVWESFGWCWNHKLISTPSSQWQPKGLISMESIESGLIFIYGSTNVFLERLASHGAPWNQKDLQHASIAFIYIGCGLSGLICDYKLNTWRFEKSVENYNLIHINDDEDKEDENSHKILKASPGFSPNPFPAITIFWTGILMSRHQQTSELSTSIHTIWGNLFMFACAFRVLTYFLLLILPANKSLTSPYRPFTEIITSFSLILGGLIFMESTDPLILSFEYHGYSDMFILNVSLGVIALIMAWIMMLFSFKDWIEKPSTNEWKYEAV